MDEQHTRELPTQQEHSRQSQPANKQNQKQPRATHTTKITRGTAIGGKKRKLHHNSAAESLTTICTPEDGQLGRNI
jgi:hypothetical protein